MWRSGYQQPHPEYDIDAVMVSIVEKNLTPLLRDGPAHEALIHVENHFLDIIRVMEDRNRALEKERVSIDRLEAQVTELEGDAATNLVVLREMKERVARLEEENKQLKKNGQDYETEEPESEEEGEWEEGCDFLIIMTHQVPERRRLKDVEAEKWTGMFRDEFLAGL